jgi:hypothetical protein
MGTYRVTNSSTTFLTGTLNNTGDLQVNSSGSLTDLRIADGTQLTGGGAVTLSDNTQNRIWGSANSGTEVLTNVDNTISGAGTIGASNSIGIVNSGTINATGIRALTISPSINAALTEGLLNQASGVLRGSGAGGLQITGGVITNNGTMEVLSGSQLVVATAATFTNFSGSTLTGGTYNLIAGAGTATMKLPTSDIVTNAATILLDGANSQLLRTGNSANALAGFATNAAAGRFTIQNGRNFTTAGNFSNSGIVNVGNGSTFNTNGQFTSTDHGVLEMRGGTFNATNNLTINGYPAEINGYGTVNPSINNGGTVRAFGGTLTASNGVTGNTGTIQIDSTGALTLGANSRALNLFHNGTALNLGGNNVTVYGDYNNADFNINTGNSFNKHANVTGTGQIIGNNAVQAITGNVTGGTTSAVTMDFGNVRGGTSRTLNYQIANTGTGADIRGAVQTAANGGSITDGQLSGAGVTAANFGPITSGANLGNLGITFTASSGGLLTGQSVAVVSNFDNVTTQVITINGTATALAAGAATPNPNPVVLANFHVGGTHPSQNFSVQNTTPASSYAERLGIGSVGTTGNFVATNNLGSGFINGGASQANAVSASVSGGAAGINSGTLNIQYTTNGELIDPTFTTINANSQTINLQATGYNLAVGSTTPTPVTLANQRVGGTNSQTLTVSNTAPSGIYTEDLNASFGTNSGSATNNGGSISLLAGGASNNTNMSVGVNTGSAGHITGSVTLNYVSDGTGTSGLGATAPLVPSQTINVSGNVFQAASGNASSPVLVANQRIGGSNTTAISVANSATGPSGYVEDLNVSVGGSNGAATGSGTISGRLAGTNNTGTGSILAGINTASAGAKTGTITLNYQTAGAVNGVSNGLGVTGVGSQDVTVNGNVYQAAVGNASSPVQVANQRIGGSNTATVTVANTASGPSGFVEDLNVSVGGSSGAATGSGTISGRLAGTNNTGTGSILAGVNTASAGAKTGTVTLNYQTAGAVNGVSNGLGVAGVGSQDVTVNGNVYQAAQGLLNTTSLNFGVVQVGQVVQQTLSISNVASGPSGFVEDLNVGFGSTSGTGSTLISGTGSINGLAAGQTNNSNMVVSVNTSAAGSINGAIGINYITAGTVNGLSNGLGTASVGTDSFGVIGTIQTGGQIVDQARPVTNGVSSPNTVTVNLGNVRVNGTASQTLSVLNQATGNPQAALNASITSNGAPITANGSFTLLAPGATNNSSLVVGMNTSSAGAVNGTATIAFVSDATSLGGGQMNIASQNVQVNGGVYRLATGNATPAPLDLGKFRLTSPTLTGNLDVKNTAANDGYSEQLGIKTVTPSSALFTAANNLGSTRVDAQGTATGAITVGLGTGLTAGLNSSTVNIQYLSDGTSTGTGAPIDSNSQNVTVNATGYRLASPTLNTTSVTIAARVGDPVSANQGVSITNTSPDIYTEGLKVSVAGTTGNAQSNGGSIANLAAQGTNSSAIMVGLGSTAAAGTTSGSVALNLSSTGAGTTGALDYALPSQSVTVNGKVYTPAVAGLGGTVNFGIVHVGDSPASQQLTVQNAAASTALNDVLRGTLTVSGPFTGGGSLGSGLAAGATQNFAVGLNTSTAGSYSGTASFSGVSHNEDMSDKNLALIEAAVTGQVNNYALAKFLFGSGSAALSQSGSTYTLDFGTVVQNSGTIDATLYAANGAVGPWADLLSGNFTFLDPADFGETGFDPFSNLAAGSQTGALMLALNTANLGTFSDSIVLHSTGSNASGYSGDLGDITLNITGEVIEQGSSVPEPGTWFLLGAGLMGLGFLRRRFIK